MDGGLEIETPQVTPAGFRLLWEKLGAPRRPLLAVSGGSDSVALMRLAAPLAAAGLAEIHVATVDHGLRPGARLEAEQVGRDARALGLQHRVLEWIGDKPSTGVQAAARRARYALLVAHGEEIDADAIMTAHTLDDQAETVMMRLARGAGPRGLAGMAEETWIAAGASAPIRLLRPLLGAARLPLRDFLAAEGATFIDDPSNEDVAYERVRTRRLLKMLADAGALTAESLLETAQMMRAAATKLERIENDRFAALGGDFDCWGAASLSAAIDIADASLFARLIAAVGGGGYEPKEGKAADALRATAAGRPATLGGVLLRRRGERISLTREPAAVLGRTGIRPVAARDLAPGARILWDDRFIVANCFNDPATLRPLTRQEASAFGADEAGVGAPALLIRGEIAAIPGESDAFRPLAAERFYRRVNRFH